jgi:hypothetical protein
VEKSSYKGISKKFEKPCKLHVGIIAAVKLSDIRYTAVKENKAVEKRVKVEVPGCDNYLSKSISCVDIDDITNATSFHPIVAPCLEDAGDTSAKGYPLTSTNITCPVDEENERNQLIFIDENSRESYTICQTDNGEKNNDNFNNSDTNDCDKMNTDDSDKSNAGKLPVEETESSFGSDISIGDVCTVPQVCQILRETDTRLSSDKLNVVNLPVEQIDALVGNACNVQGTYPIPLGNTRPTKGKRQRSAEDNKNDFNNDSSTNDSDKVSIVKLPVEQIESSLGSDVLVGILCTVPQAIPIPLENARPTRGKRQESSLGSDVSVGDVCTVSQAFPILLETDILEDKIVKKAIKITKQKIKDEKIFDDKSIDELEQNERSVNVVLPSISATKKVTRGKRQRSTEVNNDDINNDSNGNDSDKMNVVTLPVEQIESSLGSDVLVGNVCNVQGTYPIPLANTRPTRGKRQRSAEVNTDDPDNDSNINDEINVVKLPVEQIKPSLGSDVSVGNACNVQGTNPIPLANTRPTRGKRQQIKPSLGSDVLVGNACTVPQACPILLEIGAKNGAKDKAKAEAKVGAKAEAKAETDARPTRGKKQRSAEVNNDDFSNSNTNDSDKLNIVTLSVEHIDPSLGSDVLEGNACNVQGTNPIPLANTRPTRGKRQQIKPSLGSDVLVGNACNVKGTYPILSENTRPIRGKRQRSAEVDHCDALDFSRSTRGRPNKNEGDMKGLADDDKEQEVLQSEIQSKLLNEVVVSNCSPDPEDLTNRYIIAKIFFN